MMKLTILDYTNSTIDIYDVEENVEINEDYINKLGFNIKNCLYMVNKRVELTYHKEILQ